MYIIKNIYKIYIYIKIYKIYITIKLIGSSNVFNIKFLVLNLGISSIKLLRESTRKLSSILISPTLF